MITSFHDPETRKVWSGQYSRRLPSDIQEIARRKLRMLNNVESLQELQGTGNSLERLKKEKERIGQWCIRINDFWPICFIWEEGNPARVEICTNH